MPKRPRVTIINDSKELLELAELLLEENGPYETTALQAATAELNEIVATRPDLIVVDVGSERSAELARVLASGPLAGIPLVLTTPSERVSAELVLTLGDRVHHLPKPFTAHALEDLVRDVLPHPA
jgi:CheY-like chemotaxis protein